MNEAVPGRFVYNPALDGLRGLAVAVVVLYHTGILRGGWIGVEIFFVLSGYLITSLLCSEFDRTGRISLREFWKRRARRLLPAMFMLLGVVAVFTRVVSATTSYSSIRRDVLGAVTYTSNWVAIFGGAGYWRQFAAASPLRHMWSLAVEEQFYLVYPVIALVLLRTIHRRWLLPALAVVALAWQWWMVAHASIDRFYLGTDTRAFGILIGASAAVLPALSVTVARRTVMVAAPLAIGWLLFATFFLDGALRSTFRGPFQLVSIATGVLVMALRPPNTGLVSAALSLRWLAKLGTWSYGIYLVHWPMAEFLRQQYDLGDIAVTLIVVPASLLVAAASFNVVEFPLRHRGLKAFSRPRLTALAGALLVVVALVATTVGATQPLTAAAVAEETAPTVDVGDDSGSTAVIGTGTVGVSPRPEGRPYRIMLVGDSVGASLNDPINALATSVGLQLFSRAAPSCSYDRERTSAGPSYTEDESCVEIVQRWAEDVRSFRPDVVLFVYGSWSGWLYQDSFRTQCDPVLAQRVHELYSLAVDDLSSTGAPVWFIAPGYWRSAGASPELDTAYDCLRTVMAEFVKSRPTQAGFFDVHSLICRGADCEAQSGGQPVRADGLHFSGPGALTITGRILRQILEDPAAGWPPNTPIEWG